MVSRAFWLILAWLMWGGVLRADPPLDVSVINTPVLGVRLAGLNPLAGKAEDGEEPPKGVFVERVMEESPIWREYPNVQEGSVVTSVSGKRISSHAELHEIVQASKPDELLRLGHCDVLLDTKGRLRWRAEKELSVAVMTRGQLALRMMKAEKDDFLTEWTKIDLLRFSPGRELEQVPEDLRIEYRVKNGKPFNLIWMVSLRGDFWTFVETISVKVGETIYKLNVETEREVLGSGVVDEFMQGEATGEGLRMIQDVAFGKGEVAILFQGPTKRVAKPMTATGREILRTTAMAYVQAGGLDLLPVGSQLRPVPEPPGKPRQERVELDVVPRWLQPEPVAEAPKVIDPEKAAASQYALSRQYRKIDKPQKVREVLEKLVRDYPDTEAGKVAARELKVLKK